MPSQKSKPKRPEGAIAVIHRPDLGFLMIERSATVRAPGRFCFPGGGIEAGESEEEAVKRELLEELAMDVIPVRRLWTNRSASGALLRWWLVHTCLETTPPCPNPAEVASVFWMGHQQMLSTPKLLESNRDFLRALEAREFDLTLERPNLRA